MNVDAPPSEEVERLQRAPVERYTLERQLGLGGTSTVYLARDLFWPGSKPKGGCEKGREMACHREGANTGPPSPSQPPRP